MFISCTEILFRNGRALLSVGLWLLMSMATFASLAQPVPFAGHYQVLGGGAQVLLQVAPGGRVGIVVGGQAGRTDWNPQVVRSNVVMGTLDDGRVWSVGLSFGQMMMSIGTQLAHLAPVAPEVFAAAEAEALQRAALPSAAPSEGGLSLGGLALSTASSSGGYSESRDYVFCSDGSFRYTKSVMLGGSPAEKTYTGSWQLTQGARLQLSYGDGTHGSLRLRRVSDEVFELSGTRFVAKRARQCR